MSPYQLKETKTPNVLILRSNIPEWCFLLIDLVTLVLSQNKHDAPVCRKASDILMKFIALKTSGVMIIQKGVCFVIFRKSHKVSCLDSLSKIRDFTCFLLKDTWKKEKKHLAFRISEQQFPDTQKLWLPLLPFKKRIQPPKTRNHGRRESWVFAAAEPSLVETWASPPPIFRVPALKILQGSKTLVHPWTEPLIYSVKYNNGHFLKTKVSGEKRRIFVEPEELVEDSKTDKWRLRYEVVHL